MVIQYRRLYIVQTFVTSIFKIKIVFFACTRLKIRRARTGLYRDTLQTWASGRYTQRITGPAHTPVIRLPQKLK